MRIPWIISLVLLLTAATLAQLQDFNGKSLSGMAQADFTDENMTGANFESAKLSMAQFVRAKLLNVNFRNAEIYGGSFAMADLEGADFSGANLYNTSLADAKNLNKAIFRRTKLRNLDDTDLSGADLHGLELAQAQFVKAMLRGANLSHCNLTQANFRHADLRDANLSACDLAQADLRNADLRGADLTGARITQAFVNGADLSTVKGLEPNSVRSLLVTEDPPRLPDGFSLPRLPRPRPEKTLAQLRDQPDMRGSDLRRMDLHEADLHELRMQGSRLPPDLSDANMADLNATSIVVENADFSGTDLRNANLRGSWLPGAKFHNAKNLGSADLSGCRLTESDLAGVSAAGLKLSGSILRGANLSFALLSRADLSNACLIGANLRGVDLSGAKVFGAIVVNVDFSGANLSGVDGAQLYGLSQTQLDQMAHKPASVPWRLDPARRDIEAHGPPHQPDMDLTNPSISLLAEGWFNNPVVRARVAKRLGISLGCVLLLLLLTFRLSMEPGFGLDDRWDRIIGPYIKLASAARSAEDIQVIGRRGVRITPALDGQASEVHLPIRIEIPARTGPRGVRWFILLNGLMVSLLLASLPVMRNIVFPIIIGSILFFVCLVWLVILRQLRGKLIAADRSQVVLATLKARDPMTAAKVDVIPTSQFSAVSYYFKGSDDTVRNVELTSGGVMPTIVFLGNYPTEQAFAIRQRVAQSLKIADRDEARQRSSD